MGNAITQPVRTIEKKVFGVEDRNKSKVVSSGLNSHHVQVATIQNGHLGTTAVGMGGGQVSFQTTWNA